MEIRKGDGNGNMAFEVRRIEGDMGETIFLDLLQQADGDVIVALQDLETGRRLSLEFCTSNGGGRNPAIAKKLRELIAIICNEAGK